MGVKNRWVAIVSLAGLGLAAAWAYQAQRPSASAVAKPAAAPRATVVEAAAVARRALSDEVTAVGSLRSAESVVLRPEIAGRIAAIGFDEGQPVARGTVLVQFDAAIQQAELQRARAALALAQANYRRNQDLFERKFVSRRALDEAGASRKVAEAEAQVAQAQLTRMAVRAPFDGIVGIRNVSVGDYVKEGEALVNLEAIDTLKVDFRLPERYLDKLRTGQTVSLGVDALPERSFASTVVAIDPLIEAGNRAVVLRATLDNRERLLRPGMFARVRVTLAERADALVVPEQALMPTAEGSFVLRVEDGVARRTPVRTGVRVGTLVEIIDGLPEGAQVITAGQIKVRDGAPVSVVSAAAPSGQ